MITKEGLHGLQRCRKEWSRVPLRGPLKVLYKGYYKRARVGLEVAGCCSPVSIETVPTNSAKLMGNCELPSKISVHTHLVTRDPPRGDFSGSS